MTPRETVPQFRFRRLYFDTNIFIREHWPSIVGKLENVLALAKSLGVSLYLPEVVELELEAHWMREFDKKCQAVDHHMHPLNESLARLNAQKPLGIRTPYRDAVHKCYLEAVAKNKTHWNFQSVPVPELVAKDLLGMAVARKLAFGDNGSNFQDTLLYLSIIEQLQTYGRIQAAFVSADKIFIERKRALQESAAAKGVELVIYENLDSVAEEMRLREEESVRQIIERDRAVALQALQTNIPAIEEWLSAHLRDFHWEIPGWTNVGTWDITEIKVQRVVSATPTFDTVRQKHQRVGITFVIEANLQGTRSDRELLMPPLSNLEYPRPYYTLPPGDPLTSPPPESILMSARLTRDFGARLIEIEGQATFDGQTYIDVVFLSARLKDVSAPIIVPRAQ